MLEALDPETYRGVCIGGPYDRRTYENDYVTFRAPIIELEDPNFGRPEYLEAATIAPAECVYHWIHLTGAIGVWLAGDLMKESRALAPVVVAEILTQSYAIKEHQDARG